MLPVRSFFVGCCAFGSRIQDEELGSAFKNRSSDVRCDMLEIALASTSSGGSCCDEGVRREKEWTKDARSGLSARVPTRAEVAMRWR